MHVEESKSLDPSALASPATVSHVLPVDAAVFDAMGRRVVRAKAGVYFVEEGLGARGQGSGRMRKVIVQE
jgi:hypothetical protein